MKNPPVLTFTEMSYIILELYGGAEYAAIVTD